MTNVKLPHDDGEGKTEQRRRRSPCGRVPTSQRRDVGHPVREEQATTRTKYRVLRIRLRMTNVKLVTDDERKTNNGDGGRPAQHVPTYLRGEMWGTRFGKNKQQQGRNTGVLSSAQDRRTVKTAVRMRNVKQTPSARAVALRRMSSRILRGEMLGHPVREEQATTRTKYGGPSLRSG